MALVASSTTVTATSIGFLPADTHFTLIEVINSMVKEFESHVRRLASQISDNAYSFDEFSYYLASETGDIEWRVTKVEKSVTELVDNISCMNDEINRKERFGDAGNVMR